MFTNDRGGVIVLPSADLTFVLLASPLLTWSFLLLWFLSLPFVLSQNMPRTVERPQYYQLGVEVYFQPPF